mmetsp:Transcript_119566/g.363785  ORF Transcript_119566/g.363785 Transcript_119566/m.363785 type:complete len:267 (+) Transcript_119566:3-803(+)
MSSRTAELLRRFQLPPQASRAELRSAYLKRAKVLHPDVAGKSSEEQFRRLKEEYEEAMRLLRSNRTTTGSAAAAGGGSRGGAAYAGSTNYSDGYPYHHHWQSPPYSWASGAGSTAGTAAAEPQTPAQRLRNVLLVAGGVLAAALLLWRPSVLQGVPEPQGAAGVAAVGADPAGAALAAAAASAKARDRRPPVVQPISNYYKSRTSKSSVRVRGGDAYVSPAEALRSRSAEEGLGSSLAAVGSVARGHSPSEAKPPAGSGDSPGGQG